MFEFSAYDTGKNFDSTDSEVQREDDWSTSPSTQEYQKLEGKLKHDLTREQLGGDCGVIDMVILLNGILMI